jgi:uncharacterized protein (TIGR02996 family)
MNVRESQAATRQTERACMSGQAAFLKAVIAAPDDDLPRLIYADWLDERGDPRGEFIRCQIELEQYRPLVVNGETYDVTTTGDAGHADALRRRERELQSCPLSQWREWCNPLIDLGAGWTWTMRRGFVESVTCTLADWLAHGPEIVRAAPVTTVRLSDCYVVPRESPDDVYDLAAPHAITLPAELARLFTREPEWATQAEGEQRASAILIAWAKAEADRRERDVQAMASVGWIPDDTNPVVGGCRQIAWRRRP